MTDTPVNTRRPYWDHAWFKWLALAMAAMLYLLNRSPHVGFNDSLSFLLEASQGFSPYTNATSHFLYNNVLHVLLEIFFFLPPIFVLTTFSILCSLGSLIRLYQLGRTVAGPFPTALVPPMVIALSFTFWQQSEIIEVYAFNNFLMLSFLHFAMKDLLRHRTEHLIKASLLLGLATLTHIQNILALPFFLYLLYQSGKTDRSRAFLAGLIWAVLFAVLFLPPLLLDSNSISSIFFDNKFKDDIVGLDIAQMGKGMLMAMAFLIYNFHVFLFFIVHGWILLWRSRRSLFWQLALIALPYFAFATKYAVADNHVFFLVPYLVLVLPSLFSLGKFMEFLMPRMSVLLPLMVLMPIMMYAGAAMLGPKVGALKAYDVEKAYKGGVLHLLWPGQAWAKDPLALAAKIRKEGGPAPGEEPEWNYPAAVAYLEYLEGK